MGFKDADELGNVSLCSVPHDNQIHVSVIVDQDVSHRAEQLPGNLGELGPGLSRQVTGRFADDLEFAVYRLVLLLLDKNAAWEIPSTNRSIAFAAFRMSAR